MAIRLARPSRFSARPATIIACAAVAALALPATSAGAGAAPDVDGPSSGEPTIERTGLGPVAPGVSHSVSPAGVRVAFIDRRGLDGEVVTIDGVAGPPVDRVETQRAIRGFDGDPEPVKVVWSADGTAWAWSGRRGDETIVVRDGEIVWTGTGNDPVRNIAFVGDENRFVLVTASEPHTHTVHLDGEAFGPMDSVRNLSASADGRVAWSAEDPEAPGGRRTFIDGRPAGAGDPLRFLGDGSGLLVEREIGPKRFAIDLDGTEVLTGAGSPEVWTRRGTSGWAVGYAPDHGAHRQVMVNGESLENISPSKVVFSPDASRFAVVSRTNGDVTVFTDGVLVGPYRDVPIIEFTPCGKHLVFEAFTGSGSALFVDDAGFGPYQGITSPRYGEDGLIVFSARRGRDAQAIIGDTAYGPMRNARALTVAPKGARFAIAHEPDRAGTPRPMVDATTFNQLILRTPRERFPAGRSETAEPFVFSPDGASLAFVVSPDRDDRRMDLWLDGRIVDLPRDVKAVTNLCWSPDGTGPWFVTASGPNRETINTLWLGERRLVDFDDDLLVQDGITNRPESWEIDDAGTLRFLVTNGDQVERIVVRPGGAAPAFANAPTDTGTP